jgi:hypothetical protein
MPTPDGGIDGELAELLDRLSGLTRQPDLAPAELRRLCADERLRVPPTVRNSVRGRDEAITS